MEFSADAEYGWHTAGWIGLAVLAGVVFFRLGGFGVDPHENLPDENTPELVGCLNQIASLACMMAMGWALIAAIQGSPFFGWGLRV